MQPIKKESWRGPALAQGYKIHCLVAFVHSLLVQVTVTCKYKVNGILTNEIYLYTLPEYEGNLSQ